MQERATTNIGYARVSTEEQHLDLQMAALSAAHCDRICQDDGISATAKCRPGFDAALDLLKPGDTLVIWKMDRAFRSLRQALEILEYFAAQKIAFRSLTEHIDTSTPMGEAMYQIQNVFAELERKLISERTRAGLAAARRRGIQLGRPRVLSEEQVAWAKVELQNAALTVPVLARQLGVSSRTLSRALAHGH